MRWSLALSAVVCSCGDVKETLPDAAIDHDAGVDTPGSSARCDPAKPFGAPTPVTELESTVNDYTPSLSADELTITFASTRPGGAGMSDMYIATRASRSATWSTPSLIAGVNTAINESRPMMTADGLALYSEVLTPTGGAGDEWNIAVATRANTTSSFGAWTTVAALNSVAHDTAPAVVPDHSAVYFLSARGGGAAMYRATRTAGAFSAPVMVTGTNLQGSDSKDYPTITPDELVLYFASNRVGGMGQMDIWVARRTTVVAGFSAPVPVTELNTAVSESPGWISADDCVMYFNRLVGPVGGQHYDVLVATKPL